MIRRNATLISHAFLLGRKWFTCSTHDQGMRACEGSGVMVIGMRAVKKTPLNTNRQIKILESYE